MVFESIVVELVNRYLGSFVDNLDTSQLSIGLWGGDVVLSQLSLKESALDNLDLPVKIKAGHLGKLTLKVPWKSLYTEPVVAQIDGIYALAVPNIGIKYNEEKVKKSAQDEKQAKLAAVEEQKKLEAEKDKPKDPKKDSFVEKLATQVIKNLQVKVSNIHVRYEDKYTNPDRPFSIGVTLQELVFQTTDANWKETIIKDAVTQIYKLIRLDSLSVYWNSKTDLLHDKDSKAILAALSENIPHQGHKTNLQYLFKPISAVAHLRLNTKPELMDFSIAKIFLTLVFDEIAVALSKDQYDDVLEMLESLERMSLLGKYKKTRPDVPYKGNAKKWWRHAYAATLEHTVQRRRNMWNWNNIKQHRNNLKVYREIYTHKLDCKKLGGKEQELLKNLENDLDVFNICICRNQAEVDVARLGKKREAEKSQSGGWLGGWFGGGKKKESEGKQGKAGTEKGGLDLGNKFQEEFNDDEKLKLYKAIGYDENAKDTTFPIEFVAVRLVTKLNKLSLALVDRKNAVDNQLLKLSLTEICASFGQRPAANAIRLDVKVERLRTTGLPRKDYTPKIISSIGVSKEENTSLLTLTVETHPLDGLCDSRIRVQSRPLEIVYDAITINALAAFFRPPESVKLKQLSNAAMAKYDDIKTQTAAGVAHMMSERKYADIDVLLMPSYVIVPETGELKKDVNMLLLNLGSLHVSSEKNKEVPVGAQLSPEELASYAYDKFNISLDNVQLLFVQSGVNWQEENKSTTSSMYILRPMSLQLLLEKCLFANDPNLPQIRVGGELPLVSVAISDTKLLAIMKLAQSIPTPEPAPEPKIIEVEEESISSAARVQNVDLTKITEAPSPVKQTTEYTNLTQMSMSFVIKEVSLEIREAVDGGESPFLKLIVTRIGAHVKARSFDLSVNAYLGGIYLQQLQYKVSPNIQEQLKKCEVITGEIVNIINSPSVDESAPLLSVQFVQADKKGPEFKTSYGNTAQSIIVAFSALDVVLHQGVILSLLDFAKKLEPPAAPASSNVADSGTKKRLSITSTSSRRSVAPVPSDTTRRVKPPSDILQLKLKAMVESIQLSICNTNCVILHSKVEGIEVGLCMQEHKMDVTALMKKIELTDPDPLTFHPKIFSVHGTEMFKFKMTQFKDGTAGKRFEDINNVDIDVSLQLGRSHIVFVNKFVTSLVNFLDNFSIAKAKLDEAGQAMKEASKDVAKNLQEKAPRVRLDVMVSAPLLVVPQNSRSGDVIMINLGDITVKNTFECGNVEAKTSTNKVWVAENMTVTLTNLRLSRGVVRDVQGSVAVEVSVLEPMTFKVDIHRNLSTAYYHGIPDVAVKGVLEKIDIKLNQEDVRLLLLISSENLDERNPDSPPAIKDKEKPATEKKPSHTDPALATILEDSTEEPEKSTEVYSTLKVDFKLRNINIELYRGLVNLTEATTARVPEKLLTYLTLKTLGVNLVMNSDTSMGAEVELHDISMDDCRTEKIGGITRMIRRKAVKNLSREALLAREQEDKANMVIHLTFDQNNKQDKIINLNICSLYLCVYMEFLMKVAEFFTKAFPEKAPDETQGTHEVKAIQESKDKDKSKETSPTPATPKPDMVGSIDLNVKLEKPEIYLIENQMNTQTDSLIVDMALALRLRMTSDVLSVNGGIHGLRLVSCVFGRDDTKQNVLSPVDITVIGNGPQGKDHHVDISMTDFIMTISPSTIRLLSAVAAGMSVPPEAESIVNKLKDYSNIWSRKQLSDCHYWFTQSGRLLRHEVIDIGSSVDESYQPDSSGSPSRGELLILSAPVLVFKLEGGVGHQTVPLLIIESSFSTQVHNWSSDMYIECNLGVEIAYSNEKLGVWEPIIEPVMNTSKSVPHKWGISVEVQKNQEELLEDEESGLIPPPKMTINVVATEPLQLLMTKTCLDVLNQLGQAFSEAYQLREFEGTLGQKIIPFVFKNRLGRELILKKDVTFEPALEYEQVDLDHFPSGKDVYMDVRSKKVLVAQDSVIRLTQQQDEKRISFQLGDSDIKHELSIKQARKRMFTVGKYQIVVNAEAHIGQKVVSFISLLQVKNHLSVPIEIMYKGEGGIVSVGEVGSEITFPVPLDAVYSTAGEIFFQPKTPDGRFAVSKEGLAWKGLGENAKVKQISCEVTNNKDTSAYYFNVLPKFEKIYRENTEELLDQMITFHLHPTVIFHNLLPVSLQVTLEGTAETCILDAGHHVPLSYASVNHTTLEIVILEYRSQTWKGKKLIRLDVPELSVLTFQAENSGQTAYMDLGLHCKEKDGSFDLTVYSPYWIVNLTDQEIALKEDDKESPLVQEKGSKDIMLFYFRDKTMFGGTAKRKESSSEKKKDKVKELKKPGKVSLKIADAEWSDKFSLDTVGSSGNVTCKNKAHGNSLEVGVKITLASSGLTKIVTFTPFYLLINASTVVVNVRESDKASAWTFLEPGECKGYYPQAVAKEMTIVAKVQDSSLETVPFFLNKAHTTLLKLDDSLGGLNAECQVSESAMVTTFKTYKPGMATVLFVNHTSQCTVAIKQTGSSQEGLDLEPLTSQLYTWSDPTGQREVTWSCGEKKNLKSALDQDKIEEFFVQNNIKIYFVSFLDGMQRVVMFTEDLALATVAQEAGELEQADQEINLKIHDMGFSLINNEKLVELAYMGITSSGVIWEEKRKRFKAMKIKDVVILEQSYQKYLLEVHAGKVKSATVSLENKMEVDFETMQMIKPNQYVIRRSFEDGIWVQLRKSPHSMQFHAKINRLQFDNQLRQAIFPTILSPLPPPKSVAADSVPKPFVEVSLMTRIHEHSELMQIKYFKVLIQEMNLKIDQGILNELLAMFASDVHTLREKEVAEFKEDVTLTKRELKEEAGVSMQAKRVSFYDYFHISPIKIHVSFSLQGGSMSDSPQANIMGVFLQSVGVVLTDVQDVVFKLGYFERNHSFYNNSQLTSEFIRHYSGQAIKQMYVLVLGLDVLGNPFGLLRGLSEGIEDLFYEPYQGAIQGPEEFAEGLALGVRSLFGHAVGGAAGAVSRITGTLGKGLAALTLDDDYQKKRREQLNKRPATAREGFARGGKGLVMGVFDGVTGIVRKPVEGAKQEGVAGFFKGMGKGLVGVVTRPTSGVVDFASSSLEGIRRITDFTEEIHRLRPPRRFNKDGVIRPYIREEAEGYNLLLETDKGKYVDSDEYITHVKVKEDGKVVFIVTDKRIMLAKRGEIFGAWDTEWVFVYSELKGAPKQSSKGIEILLKEKEKKKLFGSNVSKKDVPIADPKLVQDVLGKIAEAMEADKIESRV
ncbi:hypothetical protein BsWGS_28827 [Bradybaena similaris]